MARIFISFIGLGNPRKDFGYDLAKYNWPGKAENVVEVRFAQTAILKFLEDCADADGPLDKVVFLCTEESRQRLLCLEDELRKNLRTVPEYLVPEPLLPTEMTASNQWGWFEQMLGLIGDNDRLIFDFTHGMRSVPIVFSSAINFLQRARQTTLEHALYAWYDPNKKDDPETVHPIVDMSDFYVINDWAESVARLTDDADARKLGDLARRTGIEALQPLADEGLVTAFQEMTDCIRNVDVNNIAEKVDGALKKVEAAREGATGSARLMLNLVWNKFSSLASDYPPSGKYDQAYFESQLQIIEVLLEHRLFMQAFTAMRELIGSLGMAGLAGKYRARMDRSDGRKFRRRFAEVFINMLQNPEKRWNFYGQTATDQKTLEPWYKTLKEVGVEQKLREIVKPMVDTRNGFDHAWTSKSGAHVTIQKDGYNYLATLRDVICGKSKEILFNK